MKPSLSKMFSVRGPFRSVSPGMRVMSMATASMPSWLAALEMVATPAHSSTQSKWRSCGIIAKAVASVIPKTCMFESFDGIGDSAMDKETGDRKQRPTAIYTWANLASHAKNKVSLTMKKIDTYTHAGLIRMQLVIFLCNCERWPCWICFQKPWGIPRGIIEPKTVNKGHHRKPKCHCKNPQHCLCAVPHWFFSKPILERYALAAALNLSLLLPPCLLISCFMKS